MVLAPFEHRKLTMRVRPHISRGNCLGGDRMLILRGVHDLHNKFSTCPVLIQDKIQKKLKKFSILGVFLVLL
jgi:hypothetical protein